jgi:tRNA(Arg) A34 adenosine deaminase TadA
MCLSAIYWARIDKIYYAGTHLDAQAAGFDDSFIYDEFKKPVHDRKIPLVHALHEEGQKPLQRWTATENKTKY